MTVDRTFILGGKEYTLIMDIEDAETHSKFVRMDVAAIVLILFVAAIGLGLTGSLGIALNLATISFALVGFTVARRWHNELAENDMVELEPLTGVLTGGIMIALLQFASAYFILEYPGLLALSYGIGSGLGYDVFVFLLSFYGLPGEEYKTRTHPLEDGNTSYVFEDLYYISLVEEKALNNSPDE